MPRPATSAKTRLAHAVLVEKINRSKVPVPVYYERYVLKLKCTDETMLIGVFGQGTTLEDLKWNAGIGEAVTRRKMKRIANSIQRVIENRAAGRFRSLFNQIGWQIADRRLMDCLDDLGMRSGIGQRTDWIATSIHP